MTEAILIRTKIRPYLESLGYRVVKFHGGPFSETGVSDLLCCCNGWFVALEVKVAYNKPTPSQLLFLEDIRKKGGLAEVVTDKDWKEKIDSLLGIVM